MDIIGYLRISMDIHGCPSMDVYGCPWIFMDIHGYGYPWISTDVHGYPWASMGIDGNPWTSMEILRSYGYLSSLGCPGSFRQLAGYI
jgi:hypothetical protein